MLASWMGGVDVAAGEAILNRANIPTFPYPDTAARAFNYMWQYSYNLKGLYETPVAARGFRRVGRPTASLVDEIIQKARGEGRTILTEFESKQVLAAYGIPTVQTIDRHRRRRGRRSRPTRSAIPVVLKLYSETITHKTDVGGVQLNLGDRRSRANAPSPRSRPRSPRRSARSTSRASPCSPCQARGWLRADHRQQPRSQFGPVLLFGTGGQLVEVFKDRSLGLPPLNTTLARRMMEQTKIYKALKGVRGRKPVDLAALEHAAGALQRAGGGAALDQGNRHQPAAGLARRPDRPRRPRRGARSRSHAGADFPKSAIRPYPNRYVAPWTMKDGTDVDDPPHPPRR